MSAFDWGRLILAVAPAVIWVCVCRAVHRAGYEKGRLDEMTAQIERDLNALKYRVINQAQDAIAKQSRLPPLHVVKPEEPIH